jgi:hypothetical protein
LPQAHFVLNRPQPPRFRVPFARHFLRSANWRWRSNRFTLQDAEPGGTHIGSRRFSGGIAQAFNLALL